MNSIDTIVMAAAIVALPISVSAQTPVEDYARTIMSDGASLQVGDLDQDGVLEALITFREDCNQIGCLFSVIEDFNDGTFGVVANQYGQDPVLIHDGAMINASGAYWIWNGDALLPYGSALTQYNAQTGSLADVDTIMSVEPWRKGLSRFDVEAYDIDLVDDERLERVLRITSFKHASGRSLPFYILDADGSVLDHDVALDAPVISPRSDRKAVQYSFTYGDGFMVKMME